MNIENDIAINLKFGFLLSFLKGKRMRLKTTLLILFLLLIISRTCFSQASVYLPYTITDTVNSTSLSTLSTNPVWSGQSDDSIKVITPGGVFSFLYAGVSYTNFLISSNGWVAPIPSAAIPGYFLGNSYPANNLTGYAGPVPIIAPMWDDIISQCNWTVTATDLTIKWNARSPKNSTASGYLIGVKLSSNGVIRLIYPTIALTYKPDGSILQSGSIGIADGCGEFYSFTPVTSGTYSYSDITENASTLTQITPRPTLSGAVSSTTLGVSSTAGIVVGMFVGGIGIPVGAYVTAIGVGSVTLSIPTLASPAPSGLGNFFVRPDNINYILTPKPPANDACVNAISLGTISGTCSYVTGSNVNATSSGAAAPTCAVTVNDTSDVWYSFFKPALTTSVRVTTAPLACPINLTGTTIELYTSCGGTLIDCKTSSTGANPTYGEINVVRPCAAETLYVRVVGDNNKQGKFQICATTTNAVISGIGTTCANPQYICSLPFSQNGMTTAGSGNDYDSLNAQCHDPYLNGEDYVFSYTTPGTPSCIQVEVNSTGTNPSIFVYDGCPNSGTTHCIASTAGISGIIQINSISLLPNTTYYILVDNNPLNATSNIPFDISITSLGTTLAYDPCSAAQNLGSFGNNTPCTFLTFNTECAQATPASTVTVPPCGNFVDGLTPDVWFKFTATFTGSLLVKTQVAAANPTADAAMAIYSGTNCAALNFIACDDNSAGSSMPLLSIPVTNGITYYIRMWTVSPANTGNFDLCLSSACAPPNDVPCTAVLVPLGGTASGYNTCSGALNEPPNSAQCTAGGIVNTVWYKAVVPANGTMKIRTHPLTLTDTQIQAFTFSGGCANSTSTYTNRGCNDDGPDCGVQTNQSYHDYSELSLTGLTPGDTIFIAVDGFSSQTGTFEITVVDGTSGTLAPAYMQDCDYPYEVCGATNIVVPDPGPLNFGNVCDFQNNYDCWLNGERNSIWYRVTVNPGTLQFAINSVTDYDFIMWDVTGVSNACALIQAHNLPSARCNWTTSTGQTGISNTAPTFNWAPSITSASMRTYLILIDNWNPPSFVTGFTLDWMGSPIASNPTSVNWTGAIDTNFTSISNWGSAPCNALPSCTVDAFISASTYNRQPTINSTVSVRDVVINSGATLRLKPNAVLQVCGNFTNNGTLIAEPGSVVKFIGTTNQTINGSLTGTNAFYHLTIDKTSGIAILNTNTDIAGNFTTATATSQFNINGKFMRVAGNFTNASGRNTFLTTNLGNSRLEFNGVNNQYFTNLADTVRLNRLSMNKPTGKLYLMGANSSILVDTTVTLTSGIINTRNVATNIVYLKWISAAAISGYSAISYIDGNLRRRIYDAFGPDARSKVLDWPVGDSLKGYQLANVLFSAGPALRPGIEYLTGSFDSWTGAPPALGPTATECALMTYDAMPLLDNGYWTFRRDPAGVNFNGEYTLTLYNTNYTNAGGALGWTIAVADLPLNVNSSASWRLAGNCYLPSLVTGTKRYLINAVPTAPGTDFFNLHYAVAQSQIQPLPIELLYFDAVKENDFVVCKWETASETNNDYFNVERSLDGISFEKIGNVEGYGAGTTTINHAYKFIDNEICNSIRYYRLKQVDIDGKFTYSNVVAINCKEKNGGLVIYPNPATNELNVSFQESLKGKINLEIVDLLGKVVSSEIYQTVKGYNKIEITVSELPKGIYYLKIKSGNDNPSQEDRQIRFVIE